MSGRVKLTTTINRRREARVPFPAFLQIVATRCARWMCSVSEPVVGRRLSPSAELLECENHRNLFTLVYCLDLLFGRKLADESFQPVVFFLQYVSVP